MTTLSASEREWHDAITPYLWTHDPLPLRPVTIRDVRRERPWGSGPTTPVTRLMLMADVCMRCLILDGTVTVRGPLRGDNSIDDGARYWVQRWANECTHLDDYQSVAVEGDAVAAALDGGDWVRQPPPGDREGGGSGAPTPGQMTTEQITRVAHSLTQNRVTMAGLVALTEFTNRSVTFAGTDGTPVVYGWRVRAIRPESGGADAGQ